MNTKRATMAKSLGGLIMAGALTLTCLAPSQAAVLSGQSLKQASAIYTGNVKGPVPLLSSLGEGISTKDNSGLLAMGADQRTAYFAEYYSSKVKMMMMNTDFPVATINLPGSISALAATPSGNKIFAGVFTEGSTAGRIVAINATTNTISATLNLEPNEGVKLITVSADGASLVVLTGGTGQKLIVIDTATLKVSKRVAIHSDMDSTSFAISPDSAFAYVSSNAQTGTASWAQRLEVFDLATGRFVRKIDSCVGARSITFTANGSSAYVACDDGKISVVDTASGTVLKSLNVGFGIGKIQWVEQDRKLLLGGNWTNQNLATLDISTGVLDAKITMAGHINGIGAVTRQAGLQDSRVWVLRDNASGASSLDPVTFGPKLSTQVLDRLAGPDRYTTAAEVSKAIYPKAKTVYIASGEVFSDAVSGATAAAKSDAPVLLTTKQGLPASTTAELYRLSPSKVVVLGGASTISDAVLAKVRTIVPNTVRIAGADRYEVSRNAIANTFSSSKKAYIVTGRDYPDAISGASAAAAEGVPVIMVAGTAATLDAPTKALLKKLGVSRVVIVGGPSSVSTGIETSLKSMGVSTARAGGKDRYEANLAANKQALATAKRVYYVSGTAFADALAISAAASHEGGVVLYARQACAPMETAYAVAGFARRTLVGGPSTIYSEVGEGYFC